MPMHRPEEILLLGGSGLESADFLIVLLLEALGEPKLDNIRKTFQNV